MAGLLLLTCIEQVAGLVWPAVIYFIQGINEILLKIVEVLGIGK